MRKFKLLKGVLSAVTSLAIIISAIGIVFASAEGINEIYASASGGGDGKSAESPMEFGKAVQTVSDNGTVYIVGKVGTEENSLDIGSKDKAISFVGTDETAEIHAGKLFNLIGKVSFSKLAFTVNSQYDLGFKCETSKNNDVTFGEGVTLPDKWTNNGHTAFLMGDSQNKMTINSGIFTRIYSGGYNGNLSGVNSDIVLNGGSIGTYAIAHGWSASGWNGSCVWSGNYSLTVNGGTVDNVILGHASGGLRTTNGTATVTVNGGKVGTIVLSALNKDRNSSGLRIAEINGGEVETVKIGETPVNKNFKTIAIFNNSTADNTGSISGIDTVIRAGEGGKISAVCSKSVLSGYRITTEKAYVYLDGSKIEPDSTGLYSIGAGDHTVEFTDTVKVGPEEIYASANGKGDGKTVSSPMEFGKAVNSVRDGGKIYVLGTIGSSDSNLSLGIESKKINFIGVGENAVFAANQSFSFIGGLYFENIAFTAANPGQIGINVSQADENNITFGENVRLPSNWKSGDAAILFSKNGSNNELTIEQGNFTRIYTGGYNGDQTGISTKVRINGGSVGYLAIAHGWSAAGWNGSITWGGNFEYAVKGGKVDNIVLGHDTGGLRTFNGTAVLRVDGGEIGHIYLSGVNRDRNSTGLRFAEINGGNISAVSMGETPLNKNFKTVLVLNNGMAQKIASLNTANINTVITAGEGGKVTARLENNQIIGYEISTSKKYILIDGCVSSADTENGLFILSDGEHTVEFTDEIPSEKRIIKVNSGTRAPIGQWVRLTPEKEYVFSYYYSTGMENAPYALEKDTSYDQKFAVSNIYYDKTYLKKSIVFTPHKDKYTAELSKSFGISEDDPDVLVFVGIFPMACNSGYFYDPVLYESSDSSKTNLLEDTGFYRVAAAENGGKWYHCTKKKANGRFVSVAFSQAASSMDFFIRPQVGKGTGSYVLKSNGLNNPYYFQKVSVNPNKTYVLSFFTTNAVFGGAVFSQPNGNGDMESCITKVINDKEWYRKIIYFVPPQEGENGTFADPEIPGNVIIYVGVRCTKDKPGYCYGISLYEDADTEKANILLDSDFEYMGYSWFQMYWDNLNVFSRETLASIGGMSYFARPRGQDVAVPAGPKMMSYACRSGATGRLTIELPYSVTRGQTNGRNYVVSFYLRPTYGRDPVGFYVSDYDGNPTKILADEVKGYKYTFHLRESYSFFLQIEIDGRNTGYITGLEMYEADSNYNIISNVNQADFFGKDGKFSDWTVQSGLRWMELTKMMEGTYPGDPAINYNGPWTGELTLIPDGYFDVEDYGQWWNPDEVSDNASADTGVITGKLVSSAVKNFSGFKIRIVSLGEGGSFTAAVNKDGSFASGKIPVGGYILYLIEPDGTELEYSDEIWLESSGDVATLVLVYNSRSETHYSYIESDTSDTDGCTISGRIVDKSGNPISGLKLRLSPGGETAVTDSDGRYIFENVSEGDCEIFIVAESGKEILLTALSTVNGELYEIKTSAKSGAVIYDAENEKIVSGGVTKSSVKRNTVKKSSAVSAGTVIPVAAAIAVVAAAAAVFIISAVKKRKKKN